MARVAGSPMDAEQVGGPRAGDPLGAVVASASHKAQRRPAGPRPGDRAGHPAEQVHDLRKDAKKLRYLLECFASLLPTSRRKAFVKRLKALQDNLGEHQDAEVHVAELRDSSPTSCTRRARRRTRCSPSGSSANSSTNAAPPSAAEFAERFADYDTKATQRALAAAARRARRDEGRSPRTASRAASGRRPRR